MRTGGVLWGALALFHIMIFDSRAREQSECAARVAACSRKGLRPVCGTDGETYMSRCHLLRQHCVSGQVAVLHRGHCGGLVGGGSFSRETKHKKDCSRIDRSTFITNLVKIFRSEFARVPHVVVNVSESSSDTDRRVLEWKFNALDVNGDMQLSKDEYRSLRELVRKVVKPKRCARAFSRHCDMDRSTNISQQQWINCLGMDVNPGADDTEEGEGEGEGDNFDYPQAGVLQVSSEVISAGHQGPPLLGEEGGDHKEETDMSSDCQTDRQAVLEELRTNNNEIYIPVCTSDGRYQKIQCYTSTGYCWCVNEDTGTTIPGTSVKDKNPKCDEIQPLARPMKGCPEQKKQLFLRELMEFLSHTMATHPTISNITSKDSFDSFQDEQIAAWNFNVLDSNKNKVLEKTEWKAFRSLVSTHRKLRRCGKKLPRYCDINHDRKISLTEWLNCLNAQGPVADASSPPAANPKRRGPNPLESYLKAED